MTTRVLAALEAFAVGLGRLLMRSYRAWRADRVIRLGAALAYYALFTVPPFLAVAATVAGIVVTQTGSERQAVGAVADLLDLPPELVDELVGSLLDNTGLTSGLGLVGLVGLLIGASLVFVALQDALDVIWHVPAGVGLVWTVLRRVIGFLVAMLVIAALLVLQAIHWALGAVGELLPADAQAAARLGSTVADVTTWVVVAGSLAIVLRVLPRTRVRWWAAIVGGCLSAVLLALSSALFGLYVRTFVLSSPTDAVSAVLVLLLYCFVLSQVVLACAVVTRQLDLGWPGESRTADVGS